METSRRTDGLTLGIHSTFTSAQVFGAGLASACRHPTGPPASLLQIRCRRLHPGLPFPGKRRAGAGPSLLHPRAGRTAAPKSSRPQPSPTQEPTQPKEMAWPMLGCRKRLARSHRRTVFAAEDGAARARGGNGGQPAPARSCSPTPALPDNPGRPGEASNLLWFSKSCARQFQRLPFPREALHRVILRNPHLRLICRRKTSSRKRSGRTGSAARARSERRSPAPLGSRPRRLPDQQPGSARAPGRSGGQQEKLAPAAPCFPGKRASLRRSFSLNPLKLKGTRLPSR